jgi:peptidoglycan-associated lipoprotein
MPMLRSVFRVMAAGGLSAWFAGCSTAPAVKTAPTAAPVVMEEPGPGPAIPKPFEFERIYFGYGTAGINPEYRDRLRRATDLLLARADAEVSIEGNCDERGTDGYNVDLGWKRAYAVRDYLVRMGVDGKRLYPVSYGRSRPAVLGSDESTWSRNRRVEIVERK